MSLRSDDVPNIILLVCDSLRADALSIYGGGPSTPAIENLAERGVVFEEAYAAGPGSSISHAALFSGQYPSTTGVVGPVSIPDHVPLLASWLQDHGYTTFGIPGPSRTRSELGYGRGFTQYFETWNDLPTSVSLEDLRLGLDDPTIIPPVFKELARQNVWGDDELTSLTFDVLEAKIRRDLDQPFFAFANVLTVHGPYNPPRPYKRNATPDLERPRWEFLSRLPGYSETFERDDVRWNRLSEIQTGASDGKFFADSDWLTESELGVLREWYRSAVRYLDDQITSFLEFLDSSGLLEDTVVILTADHGEYFGEHGLLKHMYFHFEECLHVPLVVAGPGVPAGSRREDLVSLVDIFDTVCDLAGIDSPESTEGVSVFGDGERRAVYAENGVRKVGPPYTEQMPDDQVDLFRRGLKSVRTKRHLFTVDSAGEERLYSRPEDRPVENPDSEVMRELRAMIEEELGMEFKFGHPQEELSDAVKKDLRNLGYLT